MGVQGAVVPAEILSGRPAGTVWIHCCCSGAKGGMAGAEGGAGVGGGAPATPAPTAPTPGREGVWYPGPGQAPPGAGRGTGAFLPCG